MLGAYSSLQQNGNELAKEFVNLIIGLIEYNLAVQWTKFQQFFELLKDIIFSANDLQLADYIEKGLVSILLDFFLEKQSPLNTPAIKRYEMGNTAQSPNFNPLMETVNYHHAE